MVWGLVLPTGKKEATGTTRSCFGRSPFHQWGERHRLLQLVHPNDPERTSGNIDWTIQLLLTHSPKIVAEAELESRSFNFRTEEGVRKLALVEWRQHPNPEDMTNSRLCRMTYLCFPGFKRQLIVEWVNARILVPSDGSTHNTPDMAKYLRRKISPTGRERPQRLTKEIIGNLFH